MGGPLINEKGSVYGKLTVIEAVRRPEDRKTMWRCQCECGNEIICSGSDLRAGKRSSCGKHCNSVIDETGNVYGLLTVLLKDPSSASSFADHCIHWICKCECGTIKSISGRSLRNGDTKSCGCLKSAGEQMVKKVLQKIGVNFVQEYSFEDLVSPFSSLKLRFDFAIVKDEQPICLIEYQGEQHEREVTFFQHSLEYTNACDQTKVEYCNKNKIPLLLIYHDNGEVPQEDDVKNIVLNFMEENNL